MVLPEQDSSIFAMHYLRAIAVTEVFLQVRHEGGHLNQQAAILETQISDADARLKNLGAALSERRAGIEEILTQIEAVETKQRELETELHNVPKKIRAVEETIAAQLSLNKTDELWRSEARFATRAYVCSFFVLIALLVGVPIAIFCAQDEILGIITKIEGAVAFAGNTDQNTLVAAAIVSRLAIIGLPVALYIWAIKLIVRFNSRSMLLMDDARHRVAMLNTFLYLLKQEAATIQDRGALLEAMFRRAPGHGPETVEPPSLTDIMNYGKDVGAKP